MCVLCRMTPVAVIGKNFAIFIMHWRDAANFLYTVAAKAIKTTFCLRLTVFGGVETKQLSRLYPTSTLNPNSRKLISVLKLRMKAFAQEMYQGYILTKQLKDVSFFLMEVVEATLTIS